MELYELGEFANDLFEFYGRKAPGERRIEMWHKKVKHISGGLLNAILHDITDHRENCPNNLPFAMGEALDNLRHTRPDLFRCSTKGTECRTCKGTGTLIREIFTQATQWHSDYLFRCPDCENWRGVVGECVPVLPDVELGTVMITFDGERTVFSRMQTAEPEPWQFSGPVGLRAGDIFDKAIAMERQNQGDRRRGVA